MDGDNSTANVSIADSTLEKQLSVVEMFTISDVAKGDRFVLSAALLLISAGVESMRSTSILIKKDMHRDAFVAARTALETCLNACFILAKGQATAERAVRHAKQKTHRNLSRDVVVGDRVVSLRWIGVGAVDAKDEQKIRSAIAEFTSKNGREITTWTPETLLERIDAIHSKFGKEASYPFQFGMLGIYRHASEIAHGTLFGRLYALGMTEPRSQDIDDKKNNADRDTMLLAMLSLVCHAITCALIPHLGQEMRTQSNRNMDELEAALNLRRDVDGQTSVHA